MGRLTARPFTPHKYQQYCIDRMAHEDRLALFLKMGMGKTCVTLAAADGFLYDSYDAERILIIAPLYVAQTTWATEAKKWTDFSDLRISLILGTAAKRRAAMANVADIYVINRENVAWLVDEYKKRPWPYDVIIVDESSSFKTPSTKRFKALRRIHKQTRRMYLLTGTPAAKGYLGLWSQIYLLDSGARLGHTYGGYRERYFEPDKRGPDRIYSWKLRPGADKAVMDAISDITISMSAEDYLELPDLINRDVPVLLDAKARAAYDTFERTALIDVDGETIDAASNGVLTGKLLQAAGGAVYDANGDWHELNDAKLKVFKDLVSTLHDNGESVLVFYNYKHERERIIGALGKSYIVGDLKNPEAINDWNAGAIDVLLAHPASAAYGLNLQDGGRNIIWYGLTWQTELYEQAVARLHRQGQTQPVINYHLVCTGTRDEDVMAAMESDMGTQAALLESLKARIKNLKEE